MFKTSGKTKKCPNEKELILLIFEEIDNDEVKNDMLEHLNHCQNCKTNYEKYTNTIKKLKDSKEIIDKYTKHLKYEKYNPITKLYKLSLVVVSLVILISFNLLLKSYKDNINTRNDMLLEDYIFHFEEVEKLTTGGEEYE